MDNVDIELLMETVTKVSRGLSQNTSRDSQDETAQQLFMHVFENMDSFREYLNPNSESPHEVRTEKLRYSLFRQGRKLFHEGRARSDLAFDTEMLEILQERNDSNHNRGASMKGAVYKSMTREEVHSLLPLTLLEDAQIDSKSIEQVSTVRSAVAGLTGRQKAVYRLMAQGLTRSEIASELGITPNAVKHRVKSAMLEKRCDILTGYSGGA